MSHRVILLPITNKILCGRCYFVNQITNYVTTGQPITFSSVHQAEKVIETLATRTRRLRGDQIEEFKILNGYENIDSNIFFKIKQSKITRGHNFTLVKKQSRLDVRKFSFSQRTINV